MLWDARSKNASITLSIRQPAHCAAVAGALGAVLVGDECGDVTAFDKRFASAPLYALKTHRDVARRLIALRVRLHTIPDCRSCAHALPVMWLGHICCSTC